MIFCGYQGVGKTTFCKTHTNYVDLDSSKYPKETGWFNRYIQDAINIEKTGKNVFISAHKVVIKALLKLNHKFILIIPDSSKRAWSLRLALRYEITKDFSALRALHDFNKRYDRDMKFYNKLNVKKIYVKVTTIVTNLENELEERSYV